MNSPASNVQTDLTTLKRLINFTVTPISAKWESSQVTNTQSTAPGPDDWGLVALIELSDADMQKLRAQTEPAPGIGLPTYLAKPWLQKTIDTVFYLDKDSKYYLSKAKSTSAAEFSKEPLTTGGVFFISDNEILLYLQTM